MSTETATSARVHRFRDRVAVDIGDSETYYLSPSMARRLAEQLAAYADDCERVPFADSQLGTWHMQTA